MVPDSSGGTRRRTPAPTALRSLTLSTLGKALALALATVALYAPWLGSVPVHVIHDEVVFALNAHSIVTSGTGVAGERLPLYFHVDGNFWSTPWVVYYPALFQTIFPPTTWVMRLPTVCLGALNVALLYLVGRRLFKRERAALLAAALLALTPAHVIHSRLAVDHIYPIPFLLGALLLALRFDETRREINLVAAGACLGAGVYSYMGAVATMPLYLALVIAFFAIPSARPVRTTLLTAAGFLVPLVPLVPWLADHPQQFGQQLNMYQLAGEATAGPLRGLLRHFSFPSIVEHVRVYHEFFNASFLFLSGDSAIINSTRTAGVFLLPMAVFLLVGVNFLVNRGRSRVSIAILLGLLIAPIAAVMVGEVRVNRALTLLPMAALVAAYGIDEMLGWKNRWARPLAAGLLVLSTLQFAGFYYDYLARYPLRTGSWFEGNRRGAFDLVSADLAAGRATRVYLADSTPWIKEHWQLYLAEHRKESWAESTQMFSLSDGPVPAGAVAVIRAEVTQAELDAVGSGHEVSTVRELDGSSAFYVLRPR